MAKRAKKTRIVGVECDTPANYRWLRQTMANYGRGARIAPDGRNFEVTNEAHWAEALRACGGKEI